MTGFEIERMAYSDGTADALRRSGERRFVNWPVVYVLDNGREVYIGETLNAAKRMEQHRTKKRHLTKLRLVLDDTFNKSVCLDLESHLIRWFSGDEKFQVMNANAGLVDYEYYGRPGYRGTFDDVFEKLRAQGMFTRNIREIQNSDLFKLSPFKALNEGQSAAIDSILDGLFADLESGAQSTSVVRGDPGTGKTIVAIYLLKLLEDIRTLDPEDIYDADDRFSEYFVASRRELLENLRIGFVVPQQSLRQSVKRVFAKTPGLDPKMVLDPFQVGESVERFDVLVIDEAHRLTQNANLPSGGQNKRRRSINERLFGEDRLDLTQLDWIEERSDHRIFLLDTAQSVRPADLPLAVQDALIDAARASGRQYDLWSQMRVAGGDDYIRYVRDVLEGAAPAPRDFGDYELRMFDDVEQMHDAIRARDAEFGLSRLAAGFAWPWRTKGNKPGFDMEIDGHRLRWNGAERDWINSSASIDEVGSIHTLQGYDLNYAGIIIGPDLRLDPHTQRIVFDRSNYFDKAGMWANRKRGIVYSDDDLLDYVRNIYRVLLTRGMRGTFVYVCDPALRERLRPYFDRRRA